MDDPGYLASALMSRLAGILEDASALAASTHVLASDQSHLVQVRQSLDAAMALLNAVEFLASER